MVSKANLVQEGAGGKGRVHLVIVLWRPLTDPIYNNTAWQNLCGSSEKSETHRNRPEWWSLPGGWRDGGNGERLVE